MGRRFEPGDLDETGTAVIVSRGFVRTVLGGGDALGRRIRYVRVREPESETVDTLRWFEIVGVVEDLQANPIEPHLAPAVLYYPVAPGQVPGGTLLVRVRGGDPMRFAPKLRETITALDPALRVGSVRPLTAKDGPPRVVVLVGSVLLLVLLTVLLLSAAGIHALMSFTVTQRRKEIGIRTALGAHPRRLLASIFSRALGQLALGAVFGSLVGGMLVLRGGATTGRAAVLLAIVAVLMLSAGMFAALGPARRGLRIQPMEALREE